MERNNVRSLAVSLNGLGQTQHELGREACVVSYEEALELSESIGARALASSVALNLGNAYKDLSGLRDLDKADYWYRRGLELPDEQERMQRGRALGQLGLVAFKRFQEARSRENGEDELLRFLTKAIDFYRQSLELFPADAVRELAVTHSVLGSIYGDAGDLDSALTHYSEAIRYMEKQGDGYGGAQARKNVAIDLAGAGRLQDALTYARAALRGFESYGESAAEMIQRSRQLMEKIEQDLRQERFADHCRP